MEKMKRTTVNKLGDLMLTLRRARGFTQVQMAEQLEDVVGLQQPVISDMERGLFHPSAGQMEHLLQTLEATDGDRRKALRLAAIEVER